MAHPCSRKGIEALLVEQCAPTLLGAKPASLFTFAGAFFVSGSHTLAAQEACSRAQLLTIVQEVLTSINDADLHFDVLAWRPFGALIFVFRKHLLLRTLANSSTLQLLGEFGYNNGAYEDLECHLSHLKMRFLQERIPHEVGLFLGYPAGDVRKFIENTGKGCLFTGCWKVYTNPRYAMYAFARYQRCHSRAQRLYQQGVPISAIVRASLAISSTPSKVA